MKIKLIHYPYGKYKVGEIVDLGEELNKSLVSFERAVWLEAPDSGVKKVIKKIATKKKFLTNTLRDDVQELKQEIKEELIGESPSEDSKKLLTNELKEQVQKAKKETGSKNNSKRLDDDLD